MTRINRFLGILLTSAALLASCAKHPPLRQAEQVGLDRFMGHWWVIANIPLSAERGCRNSADIYKRNSAERIEILFVCDQERPDGSLKPKEIKLTGRVLNPPQNSQWTVRPFWPLRFPYIIVELDEDYETTVIGFPNRKHVWIMSRQKTMEASKLEEIKSRLEKDGFEVSKIQQVPQDPE